MGYLVRLAFIIGAAALFAGCGGSQPPIGAPGAMLNATAMRSSIAHHADRGGSWMLPEASGEDLLYVSSPRDEAVLVYSYEDRNQVGELSGLSPVGLCVDANENIYVPNQYPQEVLEYAHGGTQPIKTLTGAGYDPAACSIDPTTGNLAVVNFSGPDFVEVYKHAEGRPKVYANPEMVYMFFCAYDGNGNLFADGQSGRTSGRPYKNRFLELPVGGKHLHRIHSMKDDFGDVKWDGTYLAVGADLNDIAQIQIKHRDGLKESLTRLLPSEYFNQFWINGGTVVVAYGDQDEVEYFNYPSGGYAFASISVTDPYGVAVSLSSSRKVRRQ